MTTKIDYYEKNLERINYWLQFAEAKDAALIAFLVAIIAVIMTNAEEVNFGILVLIVVINVISLIVAICSLFPRGNFDPKQKRKSSLQINNIDVSKRNILYWKDVADYTTEEYIEEMNTLFWECKNKEIWEELYADEIIINARIALYKYSMFEKAGIISISGLVLFAIMVIIA